MKRRFDWLNLPKRMDDLAVLDMGCNAGEVSKECFDRGATVVGFDMNRRVLALAREVHPGPKYYLCNIDLYHKSFGAVFSNSYDIILCLSVVNHVSKKKLRKLLLRLDWKTLVFEGHQTTWNRKGDGDRFLDGMGNIEYVGMSKERLPRPLWIVKRS